MSEPTKNLMRALNWALASLDALLIDGKGCCTSTSELKERRGELKELIGKTEATINRFGLLKKTRPLDFAALGEDISCSCDNSGSA